MIQNIREVHRQSQRVFRRAATAARSVDHHWATAAGTSRATATGSGHAAADHRPATYAPLATFCGFGRALLTALLRIRCPAIRFSAETKRAANAHVHRKRAGRLAK